MLGAQVGGFLPSPARVVAVPGGKAIGSLIGKYGTRYRDGIGKCVGNIPQIPSVNYNPIEGVEPGYPGSPGNTD
jgi:hypothetical protein